MTSTQILLFVSIFSMLIIADGAVTAATGSNPETDCKCNSTSLNRGDFPLEFVFGAASSAYQCEGAYNENGKGLSMWDNFTHTYPDKILDYSNGDVATDSFHLYKEDVKIANDLRLNAYRFSISWPRILPGGTIEKGVNRDGIEYYNKLIDELLANGCVLFSTHKKLCDIPLKLHSAHSCPLIRIEGIEPFVTILHLDLPQALQDSYGGFLSPQIVADFQDFADLLFCEFGDRVKYWITINEPWTFSVHGYAYGSLAPGRCSDWQGPGCMGGDSAVEPYIVTHNQLLAHAAVVTLYRKKYQELQKGKIGITVVSYWFEPYDESHENKNAKDRALDFMLGWIMEPLTVGKYPNSMRARVGNRLPEFSDENIDRLKGSFDFTGFNYYGAIYALNKPNSSSLSYLTDSEVEITGDRNGKPIGAQTRKSSPIYIYPKGLPQILRHIREEYNDPLIYITENGIDEAANDSLDTSEAIKDDPRKVYIRDHLCCLHQAIEKDGIDVKGYFVWSLMDNFEWASGFSVRFGLNYVDYKDKHLPRYPKHSAKWFKGFLESHPSRISDQ